MAKRKDKLPKPPKIPRPLIRNLRSHLRKIVSLSVENRIAQLSLVLQWYSNAIPYLMARNEINADAMEKLQRATACRRLGNENPNLDEKESAFLGAIRIYENVCKNLEPVKVDTFYVDFRKRKELLELKQQRLVAKYGEAVRMLQKAIGNRYTLSIADAAKPAQYSPVRQAISYNREAARKINEKYRREGIFPAFVDQLDVLARDSAVAPDARGNMVYDPIRHVQGIKDLLKDFIEFAKSAEAPNRLIKKAVVRAPRVPGAPRVYGPRREKVAGRFSAGSSIATVYERLKDGREHSLKEVLDGLTISDPFGTIRHLRWQGNRDKVWSIKIDGDKVQMRHTFPVN